MKDQKVWLNIPATVRMDWIHAINSDDENLVHCIRNSMGTNMFVSTPSRLIALIKSLSDSGVEESNPDLWNQIYPALKKATKRFDFTDDEIAQLSKYMTYSKGSMQILAVSDMYLALRGVLNSDVVLPESVRKQVESAFDKANGDF